MFIANHLIFERWVYMLIYPSAHLLCLRRWVNKCSYFDKQQADGLLWRQQEQRKIFHCCSVNTLHTYACTHSLTHSHTSTRTHTHTHPHTHTHTRPQACLNAETASTVAAGAEERALQTAEQRVQVGSLTNMCVCQRVQVGSLTNLCASAYRWGP